MQSSHIVRISLFTIMVLCVGAAAFIVSCKSGTSQKDSETFVAGYQAAGVVIGVDDSASVVKKLGTPGYITPTSGSGTMLMYPKLGFGVQFGGQSSKYNSALDRDSTASMVVMFSTRTIDNTKFETCKLHTPEGMSFATPAAEVFRMYGTPPFTQIPEGRSLDEHFTGLFFYPGMMVTYRDGKMSMVSVMYLPKADSAIRARVIAQPIVPGVSLGGLKLGMTMDEVTAILGKTRLKYTKLLADFWFYPQYALKVQFGIPPREFQKSQQYLDSTQIGRVTAISGIAQKLFEGTVLPVAYQGKTTEGIGVSMPSAIIGEKLGPPLGSISHEEAAQFGGISFKTYEGVTYILDSKDESILCIVVADAKTPLEIPL